MKAMKIVGAVLFAIMLVGLVGGPECNSGEGESKADLLMYAKAELITVRTAIEACLAEANATHFDDAAGYTWTGDLATSPKATGPQGVTVTAYSMMRTHAFKAAYTIEQTGAVIYGDPTIPGGWGSKIRWNTTTNDWEETP
ncbi:MAG: hypothetical protein QUS33_06625 [Dehalococcoidia bacterium]|nr:hypothetical protein [Dehalococcoidia bacterium]